MFNHIPYPFLKLKSYTDANPNYRGTDVWSTADVRPGNYFVLFKLRPFGTVTTLLVQSTHIILFEGPFIDSIIRTKWLLYHTSVGNRTSVSHRLTPMLGLGLWLNPIHFPLVLAYFYILHLRYLLRNINTAIPSHYIWLER